MVEFMNVGTIFLIGFALAMDAFAVSLANSMVCTAKNDKTKLILMPCIFAGFQMLMPILGFYISAVFAQIIVRFASLAVFIILIYIGTNMVWQGFSSMKTQTLPAKKVTIPLLMVQGVATSIDAFAIGVSFRAVQVDLILAVIIIGIVTGVLCSGAVFIGRKFGDKLGVKALILGGGILCVVGAIS